MLPPSITPLTSLVPSTFAQGGDLQWEADDAHKVVQGHKRPKDGSDPQGLTLSGLDQLEMVGRIGNISDRSDPLGNCSVPTIPDTLTVKQASLYVYALYCIRVHINMWRHMCVHMYVHSHVCACVCKYVGLLLYLRVKIKVDARCLSFLMVLPLFFETGSH